MSQPENVKTKSAEVAEEILRIIVEHKGQEAELIEAAIKTAMDNSFEAGSKQREQLFNPVTQNFEWHLTSFDEYNKEGYEYPGFIF